MKSCSKSSAFLLGFVVACGAAFAQSETVRVITPVDENGNPIGPSRTISIPDVPDATATVQPVDGNGNPVGPTIEIPDSIQTFPDIDSDPDLEPIDDTDVPDAADWPE